MISANFRWLLDPVVALATAVFFIQVILTPVMAQETVHTVIINNFAFSPKELKVKPGDKIQWINEDIVPHTATALDKSWDTGLIASNERVEMIVTEGQFVSYYCLYHPLMTAELRWE